MAEKFDAVILMCSQDTIKKYVPGVTVSSSGAMTQADKVRAITTLFAEYIPQNVAELWIKSGVILSYVDMKQSVPPQLAEGIARQDAVNSGISPDRIRKASLHGLVSKKTDNTHPAYLIMFTTQI